MCLTVLINVPMFTQPVSVYVLFFRFADEVNGEIPEVDYRGRIQRFVCNINLPIKSEVLIHLFILNVPFIPTKN